MRIVIFRHIWIRMRVMAGRCGVWKGTNCRGNRAVPAVYFVVDGKAKDGN
jgi:hypothetical protein